MKSLLAIAAALFITCNADQPRRAPQSSATQPKWMRDEPEKVEASPAVKALVASDDPDLKKQLTEAEVRAALAAAQQTAQTAPPAPPLPDVKSSGQWEKLREEQKRRDEAHKRLLETVVYASQADSQYHNRGCDQLVRLMLDRDGIVRPVYIGRQITLGGAVQQRLSRHAGCGAPSAEYRYQ